MSQVGMRVYVCARENRMIYYSSKSSAIVWHKKKEKTNESS